MDYYHAAIPKMASQIHGFLRAWRVVVRARPLPLQGGRARARTRHVRKQSKHDPYQIYDEFH